MGVCLWLLNVKLFLHQTFPESKMYTLLGIAVYKLVIANTAPSTIIGTPGKDEQKGFYIFFLPKHHSTSTSNILTYRLFLV